MSKNIPHWAKYDTLIIGAGPAGMAVAMELYNNGRDFAIVERSGYVGGLAKTLSFREGQIEFRTDLGPHRFYSKNKYLYEFIENATQERLLMVKRRTRQFVDGRYFDYPINAFQTFRNLGFPVVARMLFDYATAFFIYRIFRKPIANFYDFAIANFGNTLANFNILNYTEKIWGVSTRELHADWARQRIKGLNVSTIINDKAKGLVKKDNDKIKSIIDTFFYPEYGTGTIYESIRKKLETGGHQLSLNSFPTKITHSENYITGAQVQTSSSKNYFEFDYLVESVHIPDFLGLLDPPPPEQVLKAAIKLLYRSQVYLFITLNKERITDSQWIYFPDPSIPFARITEMKNFSRKMAPKGKTSLLVEFFCKESDIISTMTKDKLFALSSPYLEKFGFFRRSDVRNYYKIKGGKDYPIFNLNYAENLRVVKEYLNMFKNLFYIGRPGTFAYTSQDESLEMGIEAARKIISKSL